MRLKKDGSYKCESGEVRIGNFFLKVEAEHVKVQDLNKCFTLRVLKRTPIGSWLKCLVAAGEKGADTIKAYVAVLWSVLSVVPDDEYLQTLVYAAKDGLGRHPEIYGRKKAADGEVVGEAAGDE